MLTFKHFRDRLMWAAAAGYNFNVMDCFSVSACRYGSVFSGLWDRILDFPDIEVREAPLQIICILAGMIGIVIYPFLFWFLGIWLYVQCKKEKAEYSNNMTDIAEVQIARWLNECERKFK
ncbi:hypothetical protein ACNVFK_004286 [Yersinia enterocolitica]